MKRITEIDIKLAIANGTAQALYPRLVEQLIREKYKHDFAEELAIQRQRYEKPEEFRKYYEDCEAAKAEARRLLDL